MHHISRHGRVSALVFCIGCLWGAAAGADPSADVLPTELARLRQLPFQSIHLETKPYFSTLGRDEIVHVVALIDATPDGPAADLLLAIAFERWGKLDGPVALAAAQSRTGRRIRLETRVLQGWAQQDPAAAWLAMMQLSNRGADRRYTPHTLLLEIGERHLSLALEYLQDLVPDRACLECSAGALTVVAFERGQFEQVSRVLDRMTASPARDALLKAYWQTFGEFDPEGAVEALTSVASGSDRASAQMSLCRGWASRDLESCLSHILNDPPGGERTELLLAAVAEWAKGAVAEDVAAVIQKLPSPMDERAMLGVARCLAAVNPRATLNWVEQQPESPVQLESLSRVIWSWTRTEGEVVRAYIEAIDRPKARSWMIWAYLQARTGNHALTLTDLSLLEDQQDTEWVTRLLRNIALQLLDPSNATRPALDLNLLATFVEQLGSLTPEQKQEVLSTLRPAARSKTN